MPIGDNTLGVNARNISNAVVFQLVWFVCVIGNNQWALIATLGFVLIHALFMLKNLKEWRLIIGFSAVGIFLDSLLQTLGIIQFSGAIVVNQSVSIVPIWMMCLWVSFSMTLIHGMFWLHRRYLFAFLIGLVGVPFSYLGGIILSGSVTLEPMWLALSSVGLIWCLMLPMGLRLGQHWRLIPEKLT